MWRAGTWIQSIWRVGTWRGDGSNPPTQPDPQPERYRLIAARIFSGQIQGSAAGNAMYDRLARRRKH